MWHTREFDQGARQEAHRRAHRGEQQRRRRRLRSRHFAQEQAGEATKLFWLA